MEYLYSTANLFASVWQVEGIRDRDQFQSVVDELKLDQPMWEPSREKLDLGDGDNEEVVSVEDDDKLKTELSRIDTTKLQPAKPQEFEKDGMFFMLFDYYFCCLAHLQTRQYPYCNR